MNIVNKRSYFTFIKVPCSLYVLIDVKPPNDSEKKLTIGLFDTFSTKYESSFSLNRIYTKSNNFTINVGEAFIQSVAEIEEKHG